MDVNPFHCGTTTTAEYAETCAISALNAMRRCAYVVMISETAILILLMHAKSTLEKTTTTVENVEESAVPTLNVLAETASALKDSMIAIQIELMDAKSTF